MAEKQHEGGVSYRTAGVDYFEDRELRRHAGVLLLVGARRRRGHLGRFLRLEPRLRRRAAGAACSRHHHHRHHVSRPHLFDRRDEPGPAAYRRRLLVRAHGLRAVGRIHHRHRRERRIRADAGRDRVLHRRLSHRHLRHAGRVPAGCSGSWATCVFVGLNALGVELSFTFTAIVTLLAIAVLVIFFVSAIPLFDFGKYAMNIGADPSTGAAIELPDGHGPFLPFGLYGVLAALPFAVWLFLAIEQLPLAAEESVDPKRDMPKGIMLGMFTLIVLGFLVLIFNPAIPITRESPTPPARPPPFTAPLRSAPRASRCSMASARFSARTLRQCSGAGRRDRAGRQLPRHHLRLWPADLLAVARRLFPALPVDHARHAQDAAHRHGGRRRCRPCGDAGRCGSPWAARGAKVVHRRHAAQHGGVRRHVLVPLAGPHLHPAEAQLPQHRAARIAARSASSARR